MLASKVANRACERGEEMPRAALGTIAMLQHVWQHCALTMRCTKPQAAAKEQDEWDSLASKTRSSPSEPARKAMGCTLSTMLIPFHEVPFWAHYQRSSG